MTDEEKQRFRDLAGNALEMPPEPIQDEALVKKVMLRYNVGQLEAERRLSLLYHSSLLTYGDPEDMENNARIEGFLACPSEESAPVVMFDIFLNKCTENREFVAQYDRLAGTTISSFIFNPDLKFMTPEQEQEYRDFTSFCYAIFPKELAA